ncbi:MAG: hypothetical protein ABH804_02990 [archaeon]
MIGTTLIVIAVFVIAAWIIIEMKRFRHKILAIFLIALILFSYLSFTAVFRERNIDYKSLNGVTEATKIYFSWLGSVFGNIKSITTNAVKMDWGANSSSIKSS